MATPHLSHLIPWGDLKDLLRERDPTAVNLPVGKDCGKIHARTVALKKIVDRRRSYIPQDSVCHDETCIELNDFKKRFGKRNRNDFPFSLSLSGSTNRHRISSEDDAQKLRRFAAAFSNAIRTFAKQENEKLTPQVIQRAKKIASKSYVKACVEAFQPNPRGYVPSEKFQPVYALMAECTGKHDLAVLLYLDQINELDINGALTKQYGGQAVGNGVRFLLFHLFYIYYLCNAVAATELLLEPTQWDYLQIKKNLRWCLGHDCDFYTCVPCWRGNLINNFKDNDPGKLLDDWPATMELLRKIFRFFVVCELLIQRGFAFPDKDSFSPETLANEVCSSLRFS